jgi:hypothetical protein
MTLRTSNQILVQALWAIANDDKLCISQCIELAQKALADSETTELKNNLVEEFADAVRGPLYDETLNKCRKKS